MIILFNPYHTINTIGQIYLNTQSLRGYMAEPDKQNKSEVGSTTSKSKDDKDKKKEDTPPNKDEKNDDKKPRIKKLNVGIPDDVMQAIDETCKDIKENESASKIAEKLYTMLEKKFKKGWCVFVGKHYFGLVVHEVNTCAEFEIDEMRVSIFKCYVPEGS